MRRQEFIDRYNKKIKQYLPEYRAEHRIDNDFIYCRGYDNKKYKYSIGNVLTLWNFYEKVKTYIYELKKGDNISQNRFGNTSKVEILKINYKRKYHKNGKKNISSINIKEIFDNGNSYESKIKISDIVYQGVKFSDLVDVLREFYIFMHFSNYDIEKADRILASIDNIDVVL